MLTTLYVDAESPIHKLPPGVKLLILTLVCTGVFVFDNWTVLVSTAVIVLTALLMAKIPLSTLWISIKPVIWVLSAIFLAQLFLTDIGFAVFVVLRFFVMILLATLVTLTTRTSDLMEGIETGLKFLPKSVPVAQISLAISLCIRFIPKIRDIVEDVRNAQKARGMERDWKALAVPTVVRTLKSADEISEAIIARSRGGVHMKQQKKNIR